MKCSMKLLLLLVTILLCTGWITALAVTGNLLWVLMLVPTSVLMILLMDME